MTPNAILISMLLHQVKYLISIHIHHLSCQCISGLCEEGYCGGNAICEEITENGETSVNCTEKTGFSGKIDD